MSTDSATHRLTRPPRRDRRRATSSEWPPELERRGRTSFFDGKFSGLPYRLWVLGVAFFALAALFLIQDLLWSRGRPATSPIDYLLVALSLSWVLVLPSALVGLVGVLSYEQPPRPPRDMTRLDVLVCFRIVSRGENAEALRQTVASVRHEMRRAPFFPYVVEVVTDLPVELDVRPDLRHLLVPPEYQTPKGSRYKARALQYAVEVSPLPDGAWIMHLDEESHITPPLVAGIQEAIREEQRRVAQGTGDPRIGQGAILYHRDIDCEPFLTLADSIRTGDDFGRFYFQHHIGVTIFGLHGSYILVRNDIAKDVGFDFGPKGSVTEDAFWALRQMEKGRRSRWVNGYVVEQSTRSVMDFIKQRRRWFIGLILVVLYAPVALRYRLGLLFSVLLWSVSWIAIVLVAVNLLVGVRIPEPIRWAGNLTYSYYVVLYVLGLRVQLHYRPDIRGLRRAGHYVAQVALMPVFALMEAAGVIYGMLRPDAGGFHVVKK